MVQRWVSMLQCSWDVRREGSWLSKSRANGEGIGLSRQRCAGYSRLMGKVEIMSAGWCLGGIILQSRKLCLLIYEPAGTPAMRPELTFCEPEASSLGRIC